MSVLKNSLLVSKDFFFVGCGAALVVGCHLLLNSMLNL